MDVLQILGYLSALLIGIVLGLIGLSLIHI